MEKHINTIEIQGKTYTKTSTHRDYSHATVAIFQAGNEGLMVWHLTKAAAEKFARSESSKRHFGNLPEGKKIARIEVRPVHNEVVLTGKDAKTPEVEAALQAQREDEQQVIKEAEAKDARKVAEAGRSPEGDGCKCGCGEQTGKSQYKPGHDAKHVAIIRKVIESRPENERAKLLFGAANILSPKLLAKLHRQLAK